MEEITDNLGGGAPATADDGLQTRTFRVMAISVVAAVSAGVAQGMVAPAGYDSERAVLKNSSYEWRDLDPQATLLFFAVQLAQQKLVKGGPQQLVTQASAFDLLELKRQLPRAD